MTDDGTGTPEPGAAPTTPPEGEGQAAPAATGAAAKTFTQDELNAILQDRLARAGATDKSALQDATTELDALRKEKQKREDEALSAEEREKKRANDAEALFAAEKQRADILQTENQRAMYLATKAGKLPLAYHSLIQGATAEELEAALGVAESEHTVDTTAATEARVRTLAHMEADDIAKLGDAFAPLAERLKGKPISIGAGSAAPHQPPAPSLAGGASPKTPDGWRQRSSASRG